MARYPIKMLKDESGTPFVPLVAPEAVKDNQGTDWQTLLNSKLEKTNIIAGDNITLSVSGNNITINSQAGGAATNVIDNLNQQTAGVGVLDAHQGYVLKGMIPGVQNTLTSTSTTDALSAYQGYLLSNRSVPGGGTANQVLAKNSATDNDLKWVSLASVATSGSYSDLSGKPTIPTVTDNVTSTSTTSALSANQGKLLNDKFDNYYLKSGGSISGQVSLLKTSYQCNSGAIPGTKEVTATDLSTVFANVRYSNGLMGSFDLRAAYTKDSVTIPAGWYNYLYIPHRIGGLNGGVQGDNANFGNLLVLGMTVSGAYIVRWVNQSINSIYKIY